MSHARCTLFVFGILGMTASARAVSYTPMLLHPTPSNGTTGPANSYGRGIVGMAQVGYAKGLLTSNNEHAILWANSQTDYVDLNPAGFTKTFGLGLNGSQQVGYGINSADPNNAEALLWNGSANSVVNLTPVQQGRSDARINAISGSIQVGYAAQTGGAIRHAGYWTGSASSYVSLSGLAAGSEAFGVSGHSIVGEQDGYFPVPGGISATSQHATLWQLNGPSIVFVDLNPDNYFGSQATAVSDKYQVGYAATTSAFSAKHAALWSGTSGSFVDLNPAGYEESVATAVSGDTQVGWGHLPNGIGFTAPDHALLWNDTASSVIDLQTFLPASYSQSHAYSIDANGNIFGDVTRELDGATLAMEWVAVPEPSSLAVLGVATALLTRRRRAIVDSSGTRDGNFI